MSERNALILFFAVMSAVTMTVFGGLRLLDAPDDAFVLPILLLACLWAYGAASVVSHYGRKRRAEERRDD